MTVDGTAAAFDREQLSPRKALIVKTHFRLLFSTLSGPKSEYKSQLRV